MFGSSVRFPVVVSFDLDPAADDVLALWRAPMGCEIVSAYATVSNATAADATNHFSLALRNGGAAGTAETVIAAAIQGTAGWAALTPNAFTVTAGVVAAGDLVEVVYDEEGTGTFGQVTVQMDVVYGT